jgi:hypothetical protein
VKYLVDQGANIPLKASEIKNQSALDIAKQSENKEAMRFLE